MNDSNAVIHTGNLLAKTGRKKSKFVKAIQKDWQKYLMLVLPVFTVFLFCYVPMHGILIAFQKYNIIKGIWHSPFVGFDNFIQAFRLPRFGRVLQNTLVINILGLIFKFPLPIVFAILLSEMRNRRIIKTVQTVSYLPHFLSTVIIGGIVYQLCAPGTGLFNQIITKLGGEELPFLTEPTWWLFTYIVSSIWESVGWDSIIYIAAIASINPELYEAAIVDGAKRLQRIWYVTLPCIKGTIVLMLVLRMGGIISIGFERPYVFSNPMVTDVSEVISIFVYNVGLGQGDFTLATVVGLFQSVVGAVMTLTVNAIARLLGERVL